MLKLFDYQCTQCELVSEHFVDVPSQTTAPRKRRLACSSCGSTTQHSRLFPLPARYMGETVLNPEIYGGRHDTMGHEPMPHIPDMPGEAEADAECARRMMSLGAKASDSDLRNEMRKAGAPDLADYAAHFSKPEVKEIQAERKRIAARNAEKRKRARALKSGGTVNMRHDLCRDEKRII